EEIGTVVVRVLVEHQQERFSIADPARMAGLAYKFSEPFGLQPGKLLGMRVVQGKDSRKIVAVDIFYRHRLEQHGAGVNCRLPYGWQRPSVNRFVEGIRRACPAPKRAAASWGCAPQAIARPARSASGRRWNSPVPGRNR